MIEVPKHHVSKQSIDIDMNIDKALKVLQSPKESFSDSKSRILTQKSQESIEQEREDELAEFLAIEQDLKVEGDSD